MNQLQYQKALSLHSPILLDPNYKRAKVGKMLAVLRDAGFAGDAPRQMALDIGCSRGFFAAALGPYFERVVGMDIDTHALKLAQSENQLPGVGFIAADSLRLPFPDGSVDLVICNHVYEHVPDPHRLFAEIHRVLKNSGACYLGAASRLTLMEPHYHLPLLSWLPKPVANLYMRISGKGVQYYENLRTYWGIRQLIRQFHVSDYTLRILSDPERFQARDVLPINGMAARVPPFVWRAVYWLLPTYILVLRKAD